MEILIKASQLLLSLSILIVLHELGHFIPSKLFNTRVEKFYLFFDAWGKKLFSIKKGGTEYGIGWLPLGGYVKISGMIDESMDTEQMKQPAQPWEFRSKPAWQRLIIMLGGVIVNFILGFLIYMMILGVWGEDQVKVDDVKNGFAVTESFKQYGFKDGDYILEVNGKTPENVLAVNKQLFLRDISTITVRHANGNTEVLSLPENIGETMWSSGVLSPFTPRTNAVIDTVTPEGSASIAGLKSGDIISRINGIPVNYWDEFTKTIQTNKPGESLEIEVIRDRETMVFPITPDNDNKIGVGQNKTVSESIVVTHKNYGFFGSIGAGFDKTYWALADYIAQFKYVFTQKGASNLGGFISIGNIFPSVWDWQSFWSITAFLSIMLGFMNLLPIPALDGGHVMFTLWEIIRGKKPSDKFLEYAQIVGFVLLMGLLLFVNGNDIYRWLTGQL